MQKGFSVVLNEAGNSPAELLIYDRIGKEGGLGGIDARDVRDALADIEPDREILCRINSPGGNLWEGMAIFSTLFDRRDRVTCQVDGVAASAASLIAIAGRETIMPENALIMIHLPRISAFGDAAELRKQALMLDKHTDSLTNTYGRKCGKSVAEIHDAMSAETWFSGKDAVAFGLCDRLLPSEATITAMAGDFDFAQFKNAPSALTLQGAHLLNKSGFTLPDSDGEALLRCYQLLLSIERLKQKEEAWKH